MQEAFRVVDNFCLRIDEVRQSFIESGFGTWTPPLGDTGHATYPGMNFHGLNSLMDVALQIATGGPVFSNVRFARQTDDTSDNGFIHSDRNDGEKTCICYMSREAERSGTTFFRHKPTGWIRMPPVGWMRATQVGFAPDDAARDLWLGKIPNGWQEGVTVFDCMWADMRNTSPDIWEKWDFVRAAYNRAVIFDAPLFHQRYQSPGISTKPEDARLVWVSHFYTAATVENQSR